MKQHVCKNCGKEISGDRKYCSLRCNKAYKQRQYYKNNHLLCVHNEAVVCKLRNCQRCGWNPDVEASRKELLK